jgi:capsular polysaccharide biosynthesis protein
MIVDAPNATMAQQIIDGSLAVLQREGLRLWNRSTNAGLAIEVLEQQAAPTALNRWTQPITRLILRLMLGIAAGIGLAFLWHYLDQTVRETSDLRNLDVPLLSVIPKES